MVPGGSDVTVCFRPPLNKSCFLWCLKGQTGTLFSFKKDVVPLITIYYSQYKKNDEKDRGQKIPPDPAAVFAATRRTGNDFSLIGGLRGRRSE